MKRQPISPEGAYINETCDYHHFPLRKRIDALLVLPKDLTKDEATRLQAFVASLVTPEKKS